MSKCQKLEKRVKYDPRVNHPIDVELSKISDISNPSLVISKVIHLEAHCDIFQDVINDRDDKLRMISIEDTKHDCEVVDVAISDPRWFDEDFVQYGDDLNSD